MNNTMNMPIQNNVNKLCIIWLYQKSDQNTSSWNSDNPLNFVKALIDTAWKVSKYGIISGPYSVRMRENTDQK